jgi:hypothetical protein
MTEAVQGWQYSLCEILGPYSRGDIQVFWDFPYWVIVTNVSEDRSASILTVKHSKKRTH